MKEIIDNIFIISAMCSLAAGAILAIRKTLGKRAGAWWRSLIWMLLLIRLCIPFGLETSIGVLSRGLVQKFTSTAAYAPAEEHDAVEYTSVTENAEKTGKTAAEFKETTASDGLKKTVSQSEMSEEAPLSNMPDNGYIIINDYSGKEAPKADWLQAGRIIYLCGVFATLVFLVFRAAALSLNLGKLGKCDDAAILECFERIKKQMNVKKDIKILIDKNKSVPALAGILKTRLILPEKTISRMSWDELEYVFIHELTHYKRKDILKLWFAEFVLCLHWFNPVLHIVKSVIRLDIELSCDEKIVSGLHASSFIKYCNVLIMSSVKSYRSSPGIISVNMAGRRGKKLKERLTMINNFSRKRIALLGLAIFIAASLILVSCTTLSSTGMETNLGVTTEVLNENIGHLAETFNLGQYNAEFTSQETMTGRWGVKTLSYPLVTDDEGTEIISLNYVMAKDGVTINEIILKEEKKDYDKLAVSYSDTKRTVDAALLMGIHGISNIGLLDYTYYHYIGSESSFSIEMIKAEEDGASYRLVPYTEKEIEKLEKGLYITARQMDEKIRYLLDNGWLETELELLPEKAYTIMENGKTVIRYPIKTDEEGNEVLTLEYTMAPYNEYIETISTKNTKFFSRELYQELYIDLNLIAGKAYILASENKSNLEYKIEDGKKPVYVNDLKYTEMNEEKNVFCSSLLDSNKNLYVAVIKSSRDPLGVLAPVFEDIECYHPGITGLNIMPADIMGRVAELIDEKYIDTLLKSVSHDSGVSGGKSETYISPSGESGASVVFYFYPVQYEFEHHVEKVTGYPVLTDGRGSEILSLYFVTDTHILYSKGNAIESENGYIKNIHVVYKKYLGNEDTDRMYKDICVLLDAVILQFNDDNNSLPKISDDYYAAPSVIDWNMDGRLKIVYAPDHGTLFASFDSAYAIPYWDGLPYTEDERHPHLGVTLDTMNKKIAWLRENHPDFAEIDLSADVDTEEREFGQKYITYTLETSANGRAQLSYSFSLYSDGVHIKNINIQLHKNMIDDEVLPEAEIRYTKLKDIIDTAFVMAKEGADSHENLSSDNYPFPKLKNQGSPDGLPVVKIFDDEIYLIDASGEMTDGQQIITAEPLLEVLYFK